MHILYRTLCFNSARQIFVISLLPIRKIFINYLLQVNAPNVKIFFSILSISRIMRCVVLWQNIAPTNNEDCENVQLHCVHYRLDLEEPVYFGVHYNVVYLSRRRDTTLCGILRSTMPVTNGAIDSKAVRWGRRIIAIIIPYERLPIRDTQYRIH